MGNEGRPHRPDLLSREIGRRAVLKGMGTGAVVALLPSSLAAAIGNPSALLKRRAAFVVDVVRPDDFLHLRFAFVNLNLDTTDPNNPVLTRLNPSQDALVVVDLGPQHVAEQVLWEPGSTDPIPPANVGIGARLAGSSRLAFFVPSNVNAIPYDLDTLLDWSTYTPSVVPVALPGSPSARSRAVRVSFPQLRAPALNETAIEVPWWLVLSPSENAAWAHAKEPVTHNGRTELWHTRLASKSGNTIDEAHPDSVRAVWARDPKFRSYLKHTAIPPGISDELSAPPGPHKEGLPFRMAYTPEDRLNAVNNSGNWSASNSLLGQGYTPVPFKTDRLMLTALGAYLDIDGIWPTNPFGNSLLEWKNRSTLGRDHYVRIVNKGYLHPFGHRAVLVRESERKFLNGTGTRAAYLVLRTFFIITQPERTYPASKGLPNEGRAFPFQKIEVITRVSPDFASQINVGPSGHAFQAFDGASNPIVLAFRGTDWEGNTATFTSPFVWIEDVANAPFDPMVMGPLNAAYAALPAANRTAHVGGQNVAFAKPSKPGDTSYPVDTLVFGALNVVDNAVADAYRAADQLRAFPQMQVGNIKLPSIEKLTGASGLAPTVQYVDQFIQHEFDALQNKGEAFLGFVSNQAMQFATENAGGLATPNAALSALTRTLGPTAGDLADVVNNKFDPQKVFQDLTAKILGGIPLKDILAVVNDLTGQAEKAINYIQSQLPTELVISFEWKPDLQQDEPLHVFQPSTTDPKSTAVLKGEVRQSLTDPNKRSAKFSGEITHFTLNLIGDGSTLFLVIEVAKLGFKSGSGQKTDVDVMLDKVQFAGALSFVEELRSFLESLGDGFGIDVLPTSIEAKAGFDIPAVAVGVFALSNLSFHGSITVPLTGDPVRVRFGFSSRENPFALAVSLFGGGGWFAIGLGADGMESLEIGFEFGGMASIDVGVAEGGIEIVAGIYLKIAMVQGGDNVTLEGYLKMDGHVSVLGIVSVELELYLSFQYLHKVGPPERNIVTGKAMCTLKVEVLFFSISVSFEVEKSFGGDPNDPTFADAISAGDWANYVAAFAPVG